MGAREAGELVRRYQGGLSQTVIAHELSQVLGRRISQGQVSDHMKGLRWSDLELGGAYVRVLGIPEDEMVRAIGFNIEQAPRPVTFRDTVEDDRTLSAEAKRHLINQYRLLQLATREERRSGEKIIEGPGVRKRRNG